MKIKAYAKVNLALKVINKRPDNYHNLVTIMDLIDIYDQIYISKSNIVTLKCNDKSLGNEANLILKAINILKKEKPNCQNMGVKIYLKKKIPYGGGLGGGSSDAAAVLIALNDLWMLNLSFEELIRIALKVGSDVPFFLLRSLGILSGIGENVNAIDSNLKLYYLVVTPGYPLYTKDVYETNKIYGEDTSKIDNMITGFSTNNINLVINNMFNDLTEAACGINIDEPKIADIIEEMMAFVKDKNCLAKAIMSGSGSSVFCAFENKKEALNAYHFFRNKGWKIQLTESVR